MMDNECAQADQCLISDNLRDFITFSLVKNAMLLHLSQNI